MFTRSVEIIVTELAIIQSVLFCHCSPALVLSRLSFLSIIIEKFTVTSPYLLAITVQYQGAIRRKVHVAERRTTHQGIC